MFSQENSSLPLGKIDPMQIGQMLAGRFMSLVLDENPTSIHNTDN